jgi:hypothetical protein
MAWFGPRRWRLLCELKANGAGHIDGVGAELIEMLMECQSRRAIHFIGQRTCVEWLGGHPLFEMGGGNACLEAALCGPRVCCVAWGGESMSQMDFVPAYENHGGV